ncbi:hypothetical protein E4U43_005174 [Claviceps pusilla]|uniref:Uncharacterized protein n=1 Tax=Claviceps pusilla TaxID=123648 RepID=A0A9P7N2Y5_9HYPO|nr:hypothetical protein E4U43_005174 [Claviceps pusilla]
METFLGYFAGPDNCRHGLLKIHAALVLSREVIDVFPPVCTSHIFGRRQHRTTPRTFSAPSRPLRLPFVDIFDIFTIFTISTHAALWSRLGRHQHSRQNNLWHQPVIVRTLGQLSRRLEQLLSP